MNGFLVRSVRPAPLPDYTGYEEGLVAQSSFAVDSAAFMSEGSVLGEENGYNEDEFAGFVVIDKGSFVNTSTPISDATRSRDGLLRYTVEEGDTLSVIAANFGISVNTVIWANHLNDSNLITPGQDIIVLPVSGVLHEVQEGEEIGAIAGLYGVSVEQIETFNKGDIMPGDTVVVPNAKPVTRSAGRSWLPKVDGYLKFPVEDGWNWGVLHDDAVDISAACGVDIIASAEGLVVEVGDPANWNHGYGGYIKIKHPLHNVETFYSHTSKNMVTVGDYVEKGEKIAEIGNTGRVKGPTGCHVHFGVFGAQHPFAN
jgi:murein DD-endopeptidase MepM/ murein hydrolase activator NlpD